MSFGHPLNHLKQNFYYYSVLYCVTIVLHHMMLVLHFRQLGEGTLAGSIYMEQVARGWPGLAREAAEICKELGIENANETSCQKMISNN